MKYQLTFTILNWIARFWYPIIPAQERITAINLFLTLIRKWIDTQGIAHTIKRVKFIRLMVTRYICGQPIYSTECMIGADKSGFPKSLCFLKKYIDSGNPQEMRFVLTLLGLSRSFQYQAKPDYSSITEPHSGSCKTIPKEFIEKFYQDFVDKDLEFLMGPYPANTFLSMKAGPQGGPAILNVYLSILAFTGSNLWGLRYASSERFMDWFKKMRILAKKLDIDVSSIKSNRRLHIIHDPEGKARVIAIFDYISQMVFNPLSEQLFKCLRKIPMDRTFTQDPFLSKKSEGDSFHSLDLSSATDRFPIEIQVDLLSIMGGEIYAKAWKNLMVNEPFRTPSGETIKYAVGQPMGARSSWAMFTLCHHMVVQYAASLVGIYPFTDYILLGDDIVIANDKVAASYKAVMESLGVKISPTKSHVSLNTYEFAKRWFRNGIEISPVPLTGILDNIGNPKLLFAQIQSLIWANRGPRSIVDTISLVLDLYKSLGYKRSQLRFLRNLFGYIHLTARNHRGFDAQLTRRFVCYWTSENMYPIPSDTATLLKEYNRTVSGVVNGLAMGILKKFSNYHIKYMESLSTSLNLTDELAELRDNHPLNYAVYSSISKLFERNKELNWTIDLHEHLETMTLLDLDDLALHLRKSKTAVFTFHNLGQSIAKQWRTDPDLYIAKARTMQFGRCLLDIKLGLAKLLPNVKSDQWI